MKPKWPKKNLQKQGRISTKFRGGGEIFLAGQNIYPCTDTQMYLGSRKVDYWKCNLTSLWPLLNVYRSVARSIGPSVLISKKGGKLHFHAPIGLLVYIRNQIIKKQAYLDSHEPWSSQLGSKSSPHPWYFNTAVVMIVSKEWHYL